MAKLFEADFAILIGVQAFELRAQRSLASPGFGGGPSLASGHAR
jgi:hypothetical protein